MGIQVPAVRARVVAAQGSASEGLPESEVQESVLGQAATRTQDRGEVVFEQVKFICNKVSPVGFEPTIRLGGGLIDRCVFQFHHGEYGCFGG